MSLRLLYVCEASLGGIVEYAIRQATSLADSGVQVIVLCRPGFPAGRLHGCTVQASLPPCLAGGSFWKKIIDRIADGWSTANVATNTATQLSVDAVLIACYSEYFSPFWAPIYKRLSRCGIPIGTIAHDPVRDYVLGPRWWHRWSVREGYSFVRDVFVHDESAIDFGGPKPKGIRVHSIPHGPYEVARPRASRHIIRAELGFAPSDQVFLSFGQIRDGKNLDRFLRAMVELPLEVKLLVAGSSGGGSQRSPEEYQRMARDLAVEDRCVWDIRYIPHEDTGTFFAAADFVLMAYSAKFRSASGVMNSAVSARKTILASSGPGPFRSAVCGYGLGVFVEPDDDAKIVEGAQRLLSRGDAGAEWDRFALEHSWDENSRRVVNAFGQTTD
jgi:glycosyltransferase involved in cell wall biosynthesis